MELRRKPGILSHFGACAAAAAAAVEHYTLHKAHVPELLKWGLGRGTVQREKRLSAHSPAEKPLAILLLLAGDLTKTSVL